MDSADSRAESSGSSSSSDSSDNSDNSRPSSPVGEAQSKSPREERRTSQSSRSRSSSSSSSSDDEESSNIRNKRSSRSESSDSGTKKEKSSSPRTNRMNSRSSSNASATSQAAPIEEDAVEKEQMNISHEDLSEVSDIESEKNVDNRKPDDEEEDDQDEEDGEIDKPKTPPEEKEPSPEIENNVEILEDNNNKQYNNEDDDEAQGDSQIEDLRQRIDQKKKARVDSASEVKQNGSDLDELVKSHDEDALDFEAEEGECPEISKEDERKIVISSKESEEKDDGEVEEGEELEEGEVTDEDEKRPEETEPRPICRFYTRGQCTWGSSCRFLHPGVTDKGNYTMFDMVRPVALTHGGGVRLPADPYHDYRNERPAIIPRPPITHHPAHHDPRSGLPPIGPDGPVTESAWERGLRTAKEMMRKANKRKELDVDFDDKKMNLTVSHEDAEKEGYYAKERAATPELPVPAYPAGHRHAASYHDEFPDRFGRAAAPIYDDLDPYGRTARYRELPPHRMPHYEDERRVRPVREVIVQKVEPVGRGDEWNDPWMRSKSPGGRERDRGHSNKRGRRDRSYSSNSSYTSSSSSQSDSSSGSSRSRSPSAPARGGRYNKSPIPRRPPPRGMRSPSPRNRDRRRSPSYRRSPVQKRRGRMSPSPIIDRRAVYSPMNKRKKVPSPPPARKSSERRKFRGRRGGNSSSGSGSSDSSASDSESSGSSSSASSSGSRDNSPVKRGLQKAVERKAIKKEPPKKRSPITIELKKQTNVVGASALPPSPTHSNSSSQNGNTSNSKKANRREELLKQLRAVEDAIAKKRSKLS